MRSCLLLLILFLPACQSATKPAPAPMSASEAGAAISPAPLPLDLPALSPDDPRLQRPRVYVVGKTAADEANQATAQRLKRVVKGPFKGKIVDVLKAVEGGTDLNFFINWAALEAAGVEKHLMIDVNLPQAPGDAILHLVIKQAAGGATLEPLGFDIVDGIVHISTQRDIGRHTLARLYVLPATALVGTLDLPAPITDRDGAPKVPPGSPLDDLIERQRKAEAEKSGEKPAPPTTLIGRQATAIEEQIEAIVMLIQDTIGSQSEWAAYGGDMSSLRELHGILVIRTTRSRHADIERLLSNYLHPIPGLIEELRSREVVRLVQQADALRLAGRHREALAPAQDAVFVAPEDARAIAMHRLLLESLNLPVPPAPHPSPATAKLNPASASIVGDMPAAPPAVDPAFAKAHEPISLAFEGGKLTDVLDHVSKTVGLPIIANWPVLQAAGVEKNAAISLRLRDVPGTVVLDRVIQLASAPAALEPIASVHAYLEQDDARTPVIMFSTVKDLNKITDTRAYPAVDLIEWGNDGYSRYGELPGILCFPTITTVTLPEGGSADLVVPTRDESIELILTLIQDTVGQRQDWAAYGGDAASIREKRGSFIIKAPVTSHHQVEALLAQLRQARILSTMSFMQHREVIGLLTRAEEHRLAQRYADALRLTDQALSVDPRHEYAVAMKRVIEETMARRKAAGR